eukprot:scaffold2162_cov398-Prasinococcus_capsulatus_cf.AAC.20
MSSRGPRALRAAFARCCAIAAPPPLRPWMAFETALGDSASQSPSEPTTRRAPACGSQHCVTSGSATTQGRASGSPIVRPMAKPPGHALSGPTPRPLSPTALWATAPPASLTRSRSSRLLSSRWSTDTNTTWLLVSTYACESPTFAVVSSTPPSSSAPRVSTQAVAVVPAWPWAAQ